jgi:membrane protease YdiL (CAAX protease family)
MTGNQQSWEAPRPGRRLWAEFALLYLGVPMVLAFALPPTAMFSVLGAATVVGLVLLHRTPGFDWRDLIAGKVPWTAIAVGTLASAAVTLGLTLWLFPSNLFMLPRRVPELWLTIMLLYPLVSALPQELVFRPLFFRRYGRLFPGRDLSLAVNAVVFALAHAMYRDPLVIGLTAVAGWVFAWIYAVRGSFIGAVLLHAIAGCLVFTSGLGVLFYSGGVR